MQTLNRDLKGENMNDWLIRKELVGDYFPTLFDLPLLLKLNATRCRWFNWVFSWMYFILIPVLALITCLKLMEALLPKEPSPEKTQKIRDRYYSFRKQIEEEHEKEMDPN
jgi:hypothetical protein